jgi:putative nucleotidyltransferase with HDIG domain
MATPQSLTMDQLRVGLYVYLDLKWFNHPFPFGQFKIRSDDEIRIIRGLGLKTLRYSPELSDPEAPSRDSSPEPTHIGAVPTTPPAAMSPEENSEVMQAKRALIAQIEQRRQTAQRVESAFVNTANTMREIDKNLLTRPAETLQQVTGLVEQISESILGAPELAIQVMGDRLSGSEQCMHSLNVAMLSLMMARDMKLPAEVAHVLGVGALLHDIGMKDVPAQITMKTKALTSSERSFYEQHPVYGAAMAKRMNLAPGAIAIIRDHHELYDGSGYPAKLKGEAISLLARIVGIATYYNELCNPAVLADAMTPHEVLSLMFAKLRGKFDPQLLKVFIRCLGVYPPGTIVQLSNGFIGLVSTVNTARPMKPIVLVYNAEVPKEEAMMLDMSHETGVNIAKAIRPAQVPREVYVYLSPGTRVSYYFDARHDASIGGGV